MSTVRQALQSALDENGGTIPFDAFMGIALHHPQDGYYARNIRGIGPRGDFTTVPQQSPLLGKAITRWLRQEAASRGWKHYAIIECGPGEGSLAREIVKNFGFWERRRVTLHLVETSQSLRDLQQRTVKRATWHNTISEALAVCEGKALIYHNEFFDAFPCRVFRKDKDGWTELHLRVVDGKLTETFLPPQRPLPDSQTFEHAWPEGQRIEVFESVHKWMKDLAALWREGAMLSIDYGGTTEEIYHRRSHGTLRAYRGQQRLSGTEILDLPGRQDITADVNFDDLAMWARELRWRTGEMKPLEDFAPGAPGAQAFRSLIFSRD